VTVVAVKREEWEEEVGWGERGRVDTRLTAVKECVVVRGEGSVKGMVWERLRRRQVGCWVCESTEDLRGATSERLSGVAEESSGREERRLRAHAGDAGDENTRGGRAAEV